jgi:hypothetical protein
MTKMIYSSSKRHDKKQILIRFGEYLTGKVVSLPAKVTNSNRVARNLHICYATIEGRPLAINKSPRQLYTILKGEGSRYGNFSLQRQYNSE